MTQENKKSTSALDWITLLIAIIGCITGTIAFFDARESKKITNELNVNAKLDKAWDYLGGSEGTSIVTNRNISRNLRKIELAKRLISEAKRIDPNYSRVYSTESSFFYSLGEYEDAISSAQKAIQISKENGIAYQKLSLVYSELMEWDQALDATIMAIKLDSSDPTNFSNKCYIMWKMGRLEEAEEAGKKALDLSEIHFPAYDNLAVVLRDLGRIEESQEIMIKKNLIESNWEDTY